MLSLTQPVQALDLRHIQGRVFAVGDVHGQILALRRLLARNEFGKDDHLIFVGDLIDRGDGSLSVLDLMLENDNCHTVLGNHEDMFAHYYHSLLSDVSSSQELRCKETAYPALRQFVNRYGFWLHGLMREDWGELHAIMPCLDDLPLVLDVRLPGEYRVGVTHAECPLRDFNELVTPGVAGTDHIREGLLWERSLAYQVEEWADPNRQLPTGQIAVCTDPEAMKDPLWHIGNVDLLLHGHTIMPYPVMAGNHLFIDTGAFRPQGFLSLLELTADGPMWIDSERRI